MSLLLTVPGLLLGLSLSVALTFNGDDAGVMDEAVDEGDGGGGGGEDGVPLAEIEVGGEDDALVLVATTHDLEEEVGVAVVEGEIADLVDAQETGATVVAESVLERACGFLGGEIEEHLGGGDEE